MSETCPDCKQPKTKVGHDAHHGVDLFHCGCCAPLAPLFDAAAKVPLTGTADPHRNRTRRLI